MLERFLERFVSDGPRPGPIGPTVIELITAAGGRAFGGGVYRVHTPASAAQANGHVALAFGEFARRASCFGVDWLGRHYAVDAARGEPHDPLLLRFDAGCGEALAIPRPFSRFHDEELVDEDDVLEVPYYAEWLQAGGARPGVDQCVGYRVPLFLGGQDDVANLEISDLDVYWHLTGQLWSQVKDLPDGATITPVRPAGDG